MLSALTVTEVVAAFWGKARRGELLAEQAAALDRAFVTDLDTGRFVVAEVSNRVVSRSLDVVRRHRLRGADAVQLATGLAVREADPAVRAFAAFDERLRAAAAAEGFALLPRVAS